MTLSTREHEQKIAQEEAAILVESLTWLKKFRDTIVVVKFGGNAMVSDELMTAFAEDIVYLHYVGLNPVVVHGGGPQINKMLEQLDIESTFEGGYRVTTPEAMDVVRMVLTGKVNPELVDAINQHGPLAAGLAGADAGLFAASRRAPIEIEGRQVDLGLVGDVTEVRPEAVLGLIDRGLIPVVSSIAPNSDNPGEALNVNADAAASALAQALGAEKLVILTDVAGLYANWPDTSSLVSSITTTELETLLPSLESGMIPKMRACLDAVENGVAKAAIIDGRRPHSLLIEILTSAGIGTEVIPDAEVTPATR